MIYDDENLTWDDPESDTLRQLDTRNIYGADQDNVGNKAEGILKNFIIPADFIPPTSYNARTEYPSCASTNPV